MTRKHPKSLTSAFGAPHEKQEDRFTPCYIQFYKGIIDALETIFFYEAEKIRKPKLSRVTVIDGENLEVVFSTSETLEQDQDDTYLVRGHDKRSDAVFEDIFKTLQPFIGTEPGIRGRNIYVGIYEIEIDDPEAALGLLKHYLSAKNVRSCDPDAEVPIGRTLTKPGSVLAIPRGILNYIPPRSFESEMDAQQAGRWIIDQNCPYPFSIHYLEALLEQAKTPPNEPCKLSDDLRNYRLQ